MAINEHQKKFTDLFLDMEKKRGQFLGVGINKDDFAYDGMGCVYSNN